MQYCLNMVLCDTALKNVFSRGSIINIYGEDVCFVGNAPNGDTYFWVSPGDCRCLKPEELYEQGYIMKDFRDGKP